ncbi:GNAT family N-acetyltransferase [Carboxylicivirga linearis]|uniref:GNAT family N-acetyltransferase n=1 Tax=Carboxylicivirga linearis TaxID=1628157 RepID=A0ABS5JZU9_9BACT|nr:N-acetyltransferase [Carboxylicivirga linearis]MBS2100014.1 GNAT family N-acetyltransferase [Carboxylicivirga linearis]
MLIGSLKLPDNSTEVADFALLVGWALIKKDITTRQQYSKMKIETTTHFTKQGHQIEVREARIEDADGLIKCAKSYMKNGFIPLTEEEFNPTVTEHENWIRGFMENENNLLLVVEANGLIIGNIDLTSHKRKMLSHTGFVGMGIHQDWQNQGVGTIMIDIVKQWSNMNQNIEILWLQVFSNNLGGIHLYKKSGFIENGRQVKFIKTEDNQYIDNVIMTLNL